MGALSRANRAALAAVRAAAERDRPRDLARIAAVLAAAGADADPAMLVAATAAAAPLTINFQPDRLLADGRPVARALLDEGVYRTQFETRISNGGLTAYPGGDRDRWEQALFAGADQAAGVAPAERPRYGGLNLMRWRNGACPRFGSCHLQLRPAAKERATLLFGDSAAHPTEIGLADAFAPVLAPLLEHLASGDGALGRGGFGIAEFAAGVLDGDAAAGRGLFAPAMANTLDDYVEAHVHGAVRLGTDVEALVAAPSFAGTPTGDLLTAAAERHGFAPAWNDGLVLPLARVPREAPEDAVWRWQALCAGGRAHRLADRVVTAHGTEDRLDAATIGAAAVDAVRAPDRWREWGAPAAVLTHVKDLWLTLVALGAPPL